MFLLLSILTGVSSLIFAAGIKSLSNGLFLWKSATQHARSNYLSILIAEALVFLSTEIVFFLSGAFIGDFLILAAVFFILLLLFSYLMNEGEGKKVIGESLQGHFQGLVVLGVLIIEHACTLTYISSMMAPMIETNISIGSLISGLLVLGIIITSLSTVMAFKHNGKVAQQLQVMEAAG